MFISNEKISSSENQFGFSNELKTELPIYRKKTYKAAIKLLDPSKPLPLEQKIKLIGKTRSFGVRREEEPKQLKRGKSWSLDETLSRFKKSFPSPLQEKNTKLEEKKKEIPKIITKQQEIQTKKIVHTIMQSKSIPASRTQTKEKLLKQRKVIQQDDKKKHKEIPIKNLAQTIIQSKSIPASPKQSREELLNLRKGPISNINLPLLFLDEEIFHVSAHVKKASFTNKFCVIVYLSENQKTVIQQSSNDEWGTAATMAMLAMDNHRRPRTQFFFKNEFFNVEARIEVFKQAGLMTIENFLSSNHPLLDLREHIEKNGSAMIDIYRFHNQRGVIIVDKICESLHFARIRDPYHGWEIEVSGPALSSRIIIPQKIIQILHT